MFPDVGNTGINTDSRNKRNKDVAATLCTDDKSCTESPGAADLHQYVQCASPESPDHKSLQGWEKRGVIGKPHRELRNPAKSNQKYLALAADGFSYLRI